MSINITANKLAEFATAKPERRRRFVRVLKNQKKDFPPYYMAFRGPAKAFMVSGARDDAAVRDALARLNAGAVEASQWRATDARITAEAFNKLLSMARELRGAALRFTLPPKGTKAKLSFPGLSVSVTPDLLATGERNGTPLVGAARFYLAKETTYQLGPRRAQLVSAMQFQWLAEAGGGGRTPDASLCMVLECLQERLTVAAPDALADLALIQRAAEEFVELWNSIGEEAA